MFKLRTVFLVVVACLYGCGGGGGSDGSSASTGVRLLHASIDDAPQSLVSSLDSTKVLQTPRFADASLYVGVKKDPQSFRISGGQISGLSSSSVTVSKGERYSLLLIRDVGTGTPRVNLISDAPPALSSGQSALRFVHGMPGAAIIVASIGGKSETLSSPYGQASDYMVVPSGAVSYTVQRKSDGATVLNETRLLADTHAYSVLVTGQEGYFVTSSFLEDI